MFDGNGAGMRWGNASLLQMYISASGQLVRYILVSYSLSILIIQHFITHKRPGRAAKRSQSIPKVIDLTLINYFKYKHAYRCTFAFVHARKRAQVLPISAYGQLVYLPLAAQLPKEPWWKTSLRKHKKHISCFLLLLALVAPRLQAAKP